jgi:hypothetical protein
MYVSQMVNMYREVSAVHKDYALKLDIKSIKQSDVSVIQKKFVKLMASCKSTVQYAIYAAKLEQFTKSVKAEHSSFKIVKIAVPTLTEVSKANHIQVEHVEIPAKLET